jgi:hypothetical protein
MQTTRNWIAASIAGTLTTAVSAAVAQEPARYPVILSSRWFHPQSPGDSLSTLRMVEGYRPDRIDWMYCTDERQLTQLRERGVPYSLALNPQVPDSAGYTVRGRIEDLRGRRLVAPWMRNWKQKNAHWGCVNAPEFRETFYAQSRKLIDLGAYGLFVDDARFNDHALAWGGCFCTHCVRAFAGYLREAEPALVPADFDYREYLRAKGYDSIPTHQAGVPFWKKFRAFQTASVVRFLKTWRMEMERYAQRPLTFLTNNYAGRWNDIYAVFDVGIGELPPERVSATFVQEQVAAARARGKQQYFTLASGNEDDQLRALFLTAAVGSALVIPWDVMVTNQSKQAPRRYYGPMGLYQPVYEALRNNTAGGTPRLATAPPESTPAVRTDTAGEVIQAREYRVGDARFALVRCRPEGGTHTLNVTGAEAPKVVFPNDASVRVKKGRGHWLVQYEGEWLMMRVEK